MSKLSYASLLLFILSWSTLACEQRETIRFGEGQQTDLVVVLKPDLPPKQSAAFFTETFIDPEERVFQGVFQSFLNMRVEGVNLAAVNFVEGISDEQRAHVEAKLTASPVVERLVYDVTPEEAVRRGGAEQQEELDFVE